MNGNNFTNNNTVVNSTHTPSNIANLWNPLIVSSNLVYSNGNTELTPDGSWRTTLGTLGVTTGKWYFEVVVETHSNYYAIGISNPDSATIGTTNNLGTDANAKDWGYVHAGGTSGLYKYNNNSGTEFTSGLPSNGNTLQVAFDVDAGKVWFGKQNTWESSGNPATGANPIYSNLSGTIFAAISERSAQHLSLTEEEDFAYTPPTGYEGLNTTNIASATTRTASDTNKYFQTVLYEGNGAGQRVGQFQPFDNAFTVGNGALFAVENNEYLKRTNSSAGSLVKWTYSTWCKRNVLGTTQVFFGTNAPAISTALQVNSGTDLVGFNLYNGNYYSGGGSYVMQLTSTEELKDTSQWIHVVAKYDSTPSSPSAASIGVYINGVQLTMTGSYPSQNQVTGWNSAAEMLIGGVYNANPTVQNLAAYQAETVFIDGQALEPSSFGQTDTSTNRWIPKDVSGLTFGTNGFYLNYASSGDVGNDVSGNNNDWTNVNTVTQTTDSPTTNFAVLDANQTTWGGAVTLSAGNLTAEGTAATLSNNITSTLTMYSGKYVYAF